MKDNEIGVGIRILLPSSQNIKDVIKKINEQFDGKIKTEIDVFWIKTDINKKLSEIRTYLKENPLKIEIRSFINENALKAQLIGLQNKLKQSIKLGDVETPLESTKKIKELDNIIKRYETITKMADGYTTKTTRTDFTRTGIKEFEQTVIDERKKAILEAEKATQEASERTIKTLKQEEYNVEEITKKYENLKRVVLRKDASFKTRSAQETFLDPNTGVEVTKNTAEGRSTTYRVVDNIHKREQAEIKAQEQIRNAILKTEQTRRKELEESARIQAKFINKALEDNYKLQQKEELRVKRLGDLKRSGLDESAFTGNYEKARQELEKYLKSIYGANVEIKKLDRTIDANGNTIWKYTVHDIKKGKDKFDQFKGSIDKATKSIYENSRTVEKSLSRDLGILKQFEVAIKRIPVWMAGMTAFYFPLRSFQQALTDLAEIDKEMTNIRKVADATTQELQEFYFEANRIGTALGKTTQEVVASTAEFARLGYELSKAKRLAQEAILYAQVGDIDVETASQNIISAVKGFGIAVDEQGRNIRKIIDLYNEVGNNYAVSSAEIGEALRRSASALFEAGNTIEQSVAMITAANAVVRDAPVVGTALKTISMRIRGISEDGEDLSELVPTLEKYFNRFGQSLKKNNNEFKSTYEILDSLAKVWNTGQLDEFTKADILERVAGKRQGNIVAAMLNNWKDATAALETGLNSAGSAMREFENIQQSTEYKLNQFRNAVIGFWQNLIDQQGIKTAIDSGTELINILTKLTNTTGLLPPVIALVSTGFMTLNSSMRTAIMTSTLFEGKIITLTGALKFLQGTAITTATFLARAFPIVGILTVATFALEKLINQFLKAKQEAIDTEKQNKQLVQTYTSQKDQIEQLVQTYTKLDKIRNRTDEQEQRYLEVQNQLNELVPTLTDHIDDKGQAHLKNADAIKEELNYLERLTQLEKERRLLEADKEFEKFHKRRVELQREINRAEAEIAGAQPIPGAEISDEQLAKINRYKITILGLQKQLLDLRDQEIQTLKEIADVQIDEKYVEIFDKITESIDTSDKSASELIGTFSILNDIFKAINSDKNFVFTRTFEKSLGNIGLDNNKINEIRNIILNIGKDAQTATTSTYDFNSELQQLQKTLSKGILRIEKINSVLQDYNETGQFNLKTIIELSSEYPQLLELLGDESALKHELINLVKQEEEAQRIAYINKMMMSEQFYKNSILGNQTLVNELERAYGIDLNNYKSLAEAKLAVEKNLLNSVAGMWAKFYDAQGNFTGKIIDGGRTVVDTAGNETYITPEMRKQLSAYLKGLDEIRNRFNNIVLETSKINFSGIGFKNSTSSGASKNEFLKIFDLSEQKLNQINNLITQLQDKLEDVTTYEEKSIIFDQLIKAYQEKYNILESIRKKQNSELYLIIKQLEKYLSASDYQKLLKGDYSNLKITNEKVAELIDKFQSLSSELNNTKNEINGIDNAIRQFQLDKFNNNISKIDVSITDLTNSISILESELQLLEIGTIEYDNKLKELVAANKQYETVLQSKKALIEQELALVEQGTIRYYELSQALQEVTRQLVDQQLKIKQQLNNIADEVISIYKDVYEKQRDIALDSIDEQIKAEEERHKVAMDNLDDEYKRIEDIINQKLKLIDRQEDEEDYNKQLAKLQKEQQEIQKQINVLSLDDSFEAQAKLKELKEQLAEKEIEIEEHKHERTIELRKQNLKDQLDNYKEDIDKKKKIEDNKYETEKRRLEKIRQETQKHYDNLINDERRYAQIREDILNGNLSNIESALDTFANYIRNNMDTIGESISQNVLDKIAQVKQELQGIDYYYNEIPDTSTTKPETTTPETTTPERKRFVSGGGSIVYEVDENANIYKNGRYLELTAEQLKYLNQDPAGIQALEYARWLKQNRKHDGGFVGINQPPNKISEIVQKLFNKKSDEQLVLALKKEFFVPQENIFKNFVPNMQKLLSSITSPQIIVNSGEGYGGINMPIYIDRVYTEDKDSLNRFFNRINIGLKKIGKK